MRIALAAATLMGCEEPVTPAADYLAGMGDPAACSAIADVALQGECAAFAAEAQASSGDVTGAKEACAQVAHPVWGMECWFMVADATRATGEEARGICGRAGRFQQQCRAHAMGREGDAILDQYLPQQPDAAHAALVEALKLWLDGPRARRRAAELLSHRLAAHERERPFDVAWCGALPEDICSDALTLRLEPGLAALSEPERSEACAKRETLGTGWTPASQGVADSAWERLCP